MDFVRKNINELTVLQIEEIGQEMIVEAMKSAYADTLFFLDRDHIFQGIFTVGDYNRNFDQCASTISINKNCKYLSEGSEAEEKAKKIFETTKIKIIPVVNDRHEMIYAYSRVQDHIQEYLRFLPRLNEIRKYRPYGIQHYLREKNITKLAIWGIYHITLQLCEELADCADVTVFGLYDKIENQFKGEWGLNPQIKKIWRGFYNFDFNNEVSYTVPLENLFENEELDCILVANGDDVEKAQFLANCYPSIRIILLWDLLDDVLKEQEHHCYEQNVLKLEEQGVSVFTVGLPDSREELEEPGVEYPDNKISLGNFDSDEEYHLFLMEYKRRPLMFPKGKLRPYGDYHSKYINCVNGERLVFGQPCENFSHTIYLIGPCVVDSYSAKDEDTVASQLQKKINQSLCKKMRVRAFGGGSGISKLKYMFWNWLDELVFKPGDIVILIIQKKRFDRYYIPCHLDLTEDFRTLYRKENFFTDCPIHCNYKGYRLIAECIYDKLIKTYIPKTALYHGGGGVEKRN